MSPILWSLFACGAQTVTGTPTQLLLGGSATFSVDETAGRARLRVRTIQPARGTLPAERQGLKLDECATLEPQQHVDGEVLREADVRAWCDGQELVLSQVFPGFAEHLFPRLPPPATACEIEIDGVRLVLPPLPAAPEMALVRGQLLWEPAGADELRFVIPRSEGQATICRLRDDGQAPAPTGSRLQLSFASRVNLAVPVLSAETEARLPLSVIAGVWRSPPD